MLKCCCQKFSENSDKIIQIQLRQAINLSRLRFALFILKL